MMTLEDNLNLLQKSDRYGRIYNGKEEFMPVPSQILSKFNSPISTAKVGTPTLIERCDVTTKAYSSYVIESKLQENTVIEGFYGTVGALVINSQNKIKVYSGANAWACTNLSVFGAEFVESMSLTGSLNTLEDIIFKAEQNMVQRLETIKAIKERLEGKTYTTKAFEDRKGQLISTMDISLFEYIRHSEKVIRDKNSIYSDAPKSDWLLLSSMTDLIKTQSPTKRVESTLALEKYFA